MARTEVNVENVCTPRDSACMANGKKTLGAILSEMRARTDLSVRDVAIKAGYRTGSGVQRYFTDHYDADFLPVPLAAKLVKAFKDTDVSSAEIMALTGLPESNARVVEFEGPTGEPMPRDVPVYGTALGCEREIGGVAVEQTTLNTAEVITYIRRPAMLAGRDGIYGLFVQGSSMAPRFEEGETILVDGKRPARIGDDVVVYLRDGERDDGETAAAVLVKRLVRRTGEHYELQQFTPAATFRVPAPLVLKVHRVIPATELLS